MTSSAVEPRNPGSSSFAWLNFAAGGSLGLVIGGLAGMSVSPVVGALLGTVATAGVAFLTLGREGAGPANLLRMTAFGLGCLLAATGGVYVRSNNLLGLTPRRHVAQLEEAGYSREKALELFERTLTATSGQGESTVATNPGSGLFAGELGSTRDELVDMLRRNQDWTSIRQTVATAYPSWQKIADIINAAPLEAGEKRRLLLAITEAL